MGGGGTICMGCGSVVSDNRTHLPCQLCRGTNFSTYASGDEIREAQRAIKSRSEGSRGKGKRGERD